MPLAGVSAFLAVRRVTRSATVRVWVAASYALLPVATGAVAAGRIGTAVVFILIPVIALLAGNMLTQPPRRARRAAWATGLTLALAAAFVPLVWVIAVVAALTFVAVRPAMWRNLVIVAVVPPVLLLPWSAQLASNPSALLLEVGLQPPGLTTSDLSARSLLLLSPGGPGLPPVWVTAGIAFAALVALLLSRRRALMMAGWGLALGGLLIAVAVSRAMIRPANGGSAASAWPGVALLLAAVGLLIAGATAVEALPRVLKGGRAGPSPRPGAAAAPLTATTAGGAPWRTVGVLLLAVVAFSAPVWAATSWVIRGVPGPVAPVSRPVVPAVVSASGSGLQPRTLVLQPENGHVGYSLQRGDSPSFGDPDLPPVPAAERALNTAVAALVAPNGGEAVDQGQMLARFDIGYVLLPAPVDQSLARLLDGVAGLRPVSATSAFALWRLQSLSARVRVVEPNGTVVGVRSGQISVTGAQAPAAGGTLELAEPAGGWHATVNGQPLTPVASSAGGWAQAYRLPAGGGVLNISHNQTSRELALVLELLAVAAVAVLALPGSRTAAEASASAAGGATGRSRAGGRPDPDESDADLGTEAEPEAEPAGAGAAPTPSPAIRTTLGGRMGAGLAAAPPRGPAGPAAGSGGAGRLALARAAGPGRGEVGHQPGGGRRRPQDGRTAARVTGRRSRGPPGRRAACQGRARDGRPRSPGRTRPWFLVRDGISLRAAACPRRLAGRPRIRRTRARGGQPLSQVRIRPRRSRRGLATLRAPMTRSRGRAGPRPSPRAACRCRIPAGRPIRGDRTRRPRGSEWSPGTPGGDPAQLGSGWSASPPAERARLLVRSRRAGSAIRLVVP